MNTHHRHKKPGIGKMKRPLFVVAGTALLAGILFAVWVGMTALEGTEPEMRFKTQPSIIGSACEMAVIAEDTGSGLKRVWVALLQKDKKEVVLLDQTFPAQGILRRGLVHNKPLKIVVRPRELGLFDGRAVIRAQVWDYSYRGWGDGNRSYKEFNVTIDTQPPVVEILTQTNYVNQGGAGLVAYGVRTSKPLVTNGVHVNELFFPGVSGLFSDPNVYVSLFAIPSDKGPETVPQLTVADVAGNTSQASFDCRIKPKVFRAETIPLSDNFLQRKLPMLEATLGLPSGKPWADRFVAVNSIGRTMNHKTVMDVCKVSDSKRHWKDTFLRLPAAAPRAGFADRRSYQYQDKIIDNQSHLGVDLASLAHSPVPAANNGRVVFAHDLGIYGGTIIIDHGLGLFSMYSHLSQLLVQAGQMVTRGNIIARTGDTGMAGGDHLHFAMLIRGTFVTPVEWWDQMWIKHNIEDKLAEAQSSLKASSAVPGGTTAP